MSLCQSLSSRLFYFPLSLKYFFLRSLILLLISGYILLFYFLLMLGRGGLKISSTPIPKYYSRIRHTLRPYSVRTVGRIDILLIAYCMRRHHPKQRLYNCTDRDNIKANVYCLQLASAEGAEQILFTNRVYAWDSQLKLGLEPDSVRLWKDIFFLLHSSPGVQPPGNFSLIVLIVGVLGSVPNYCGHNGNC